MAEFVVKDASIRIGATSSSLTDLSDHCRSVTIDFSVDLQDKTAMGSSYRKRLSGLKDWTGTFEFNGDYAANKVDAVLWPILGTTGGFCIIKSKSSAVGAGNPRYYGEFLMASYTPITGTVGNIDVANVPIQGNGALFRSTSST